MSMLGHKRINNTQIYINLEQAIFSEGDGSEYATKVAKTVRAAGKLLEVGFEYVTDMNGYKLFRKRKWTSSLYGKNKNLADGNFSVCSGYIANNRASPLFSNWFLGFRHKKEDNSNTLLVLCMHANVEIDIIKTLSEKEWGKPMQVFDLVTKQKLNELSIIRRSADFMQKCNLTYNKSSCNLL